MIPAMEPAIAISEYWAGSRAVIFRMSSIVAYNSPMIQPANSVGAKSPATPPPLLVADEPMPFNNNIPAQAMVSIMLLLFVWGIIGLYVSADVWPFITFVIVSYPSPYKAGKRYAMSPMVSPDISHRI